MTKLKNYKKAIITFISVFNILNPIDSTMAKSVTPLKDHKFMEKYNQQSKLSVETWNKLVQYAHDYVLNNIDKIVPEKNESGFYRINLKAPDFISKDLGIDKLRLHYWPTDNSNKVQEESIHNHPKYFESLIINGGYTHSVYDIVTNPKNENANNFTLFKVDKNGDNTKSSQNLGNVYLSDPKDENMKEGQIAVMPTDTIHRVRFSVPGSLSMNVVYKNKENKSHYNVMLSKNGSLDDIKTSRTKISGKLRKAVINEIEKRLLNSLFQLK